MRDKPHFIKFVLPLFLLVTLPAFAAVKPRPAALDRPALILRGNRAEHSVILAVARAGKRLVAAGEHGIVLTSDDNGEHWKQSAVPTSVNLVTLRFIDARHGWALGNMGIVLHTADGGLTWHKQLDGVQAAKLAVDAVRTSDDNRVIKRADRLVSDGPDKPFFDISMDADGLGFVTGAFNLMFRTTDGGRHWQYWSPRVKNPFGYHLYGIARLGKAYIIAGEQGHLWRAPDGSGIFSPLKSPYDGSFFGILATRAGDLLIYGLVGHAFISRDGGKSWERCKVDTNASFSDATQLKDGRIVLASQAGELFVSADQGRSFQALQGLPGVPFTSVTQAASGDLIVGSLLGVQRVPLVLSNHPN